MRQVKDVVTFDRLCQILKVDSLDTFSERLFEYDNDDVDDESHDEEITQYKNAVVGVAEDLFAKHGLSLVERKDKWSYKVVPVESWASSCREIVQTINGVGYFEFRGARELCESGPWTMRQAVLTHLGWIADWPDVYEGRKARSLVEGRMRR
jgi:hypothetical protein